MLEFVVLLTIGLFAGWNWSKNPYVLYGLAGGFVYIISWNVDSVGLTVILLVTGMILTSLMFCWSGEKEIEK